jgi:probable HAF family extracellular repeat protein
LAVDRSGTFVVGHSYDKHGNLHAVEWTYQNGAWSITSLQPLPATTGAFARGVNDDGDVAGNTTPGATSRPVIWPIAGGFILIDCGGEPGSATAYGMSAGAQVVVGVFRQGAAGTASVWRPGSCRETLLPLFEGGGSIASAINADASIVGGSALPSLQAPSSVPVRWTNQAGVWQIEQLDSRAGAALAANSIGDLAGLVTVSCAVANGCSRAVIWYAAGGSRELATLGGTDSWARGLNTAGEVVGLSTQSNGTNTGFFWSESTGMVPLPIKGPWAGANALSDVRPDGSRIVVGVDSTGSPIAWTVRIP